MKSLFRSMIAVALLSTAIFAAGKEPFVANISTDRPAKMEMATHMTYMFQKAGHPTTVFLNCRAVLAASKSHKEYAEAQENLTKLVKNGADLLVCPMCIKRNNIDPKDLIDGAKVANHELLEKAVFAPNARTLSW